MMYPSKFSLFGRLTLWVLAGSLVLAACDGSDTMAPTDAEPAGSPSPGGPQFACIGCPVVSSHILFSTLVAPQNLSAVNNDIYVMNPDGTGRRAVFASAADDYDPAWSPNGGKLVFCRKTNYINWAFGGLWTVGYDGTGLWPVTNDSSDKGPSWSKTNRIAFHSTRETAATGTNEIYSINPDGSGLTRLTNNTAEDRDASWSPDGSKIVFASNRSHRGIGGKLHLYVMNADGTGVKQLTTGSSSEDQPAWSPDGSKIAYHTPDGVYTVNPDGSGAGPWIFSIDGGIGGPTLYFRGQPAWSPDGKTVAHTVHKAGPYQIQAQPYPNGQGSTLTPQSASDQFPAWY